MLGAFENCITNTKNWYTIVALGAIFAIFTTLDVMVVVFQPDVRQKILKPMF